MDYKRLVEQIKQTPPIWDRNCPFFRDKEAKELAWEDIGKKMGLAAVTCKDVFKSLREKYLRERDKAQTQSEESSQWHLLADMKFLDPHILPRSAPGCGANNTNSASEDDISVSSETDPTDFDKRLIDMVRKASPIWDRNSNTYPNRTSKNQLWEHISLALNRDSNTCMLRWKALREKYIRQKAKFQEGEAKWELLDDLKFLDKVIQYRRKHSDVLMSHGIGNRFASMTRDFSNYSETKNNYNYIQCTTEMDDYTCTDSSNDFLAIVKEEGAVQRMADSSYNNGKRSREPSVDYSTDKRVKFEDNTNSNIKTPEQLFGDLVASLLSKKPENERNLYMIQIMTVLSK